MIHIKIKKTFKNGTVLPPSQFKKKDSANTFETLCGPFPSHTPHSLL